MVKEFKVGQYYRILDRTAIFGEDFADYPSLEVGDVFEVVSDPDTFLVFDAYAVSSIDSDKFELATKKQVDQYYKCQVLNNLKINKISICDREEH